MAAMNKPNQAELSQIWAPLILILAQIQHLAPAHILRRMMALGRSAPVCQIWATSKP